MKTLRERIEEAMRRHPYLTQADVARACKVTTPSVAGWLNGTTKTLKSETARLAARLFRCDQNWLATGVGSPNWLGIAIPIGRVEESTPLYPSARPPSLDEALELLIDVLLDLPPSRWVSVRAQLDAIVGRPEMRDDTLAELRTLLAVDSRKRQVNS